MQVKNKKKSIKSGWTMSILTNRYEVANIIKPIEQAFVVAAPTYPITISTKDNGADKSS